MSTNSIPPNVQLMNYIVGKWISQPIYVAAELGIADLLDEGPKSVAELASATDSHPDSLYRMMRALASVGIFSENEGQRFALTPMAECLKEDGMRSIALLFNSPWSERAWEYLKDNVATGTTAFELAHGMPVAQWLEHNPDAAQIFNDANAVKTAGFQRSILDAYDFSGISTLTDIGGGRGGLVAEILLAYPGMKGVLAELPSVAKEGYETILSKGLEKRCRVLDCDFFKEVPGGSDIYLMLNILHDWSDKQCRIILANCKKAMSPEAKVLIIEMMVPSLNRPSIAKLLDLEMMVTTGGRERTEREFNGLLSSSGFAVSRIIPVEGDLCIIEAVCA